MEQYLDFDGMEWKNYLFQINFILDQSFTKLFRTLNSELFLVFCARFQLVFQNKKEEKRTGKPIKRRLLKTIICFYFALFFSFCELGNSWPKAQINFH